MGPVLIAVAILGVLGGVAYLSRRTGRGEVQSMRSYHDALGTMERFPTRSATTAVRPPPPVGPGPGSGPPGEPSVRPVAPGSGPLPRPEARPARLLFDDAAAPDPPPPTSTDLGVRRDRRHRRHALETMNRRSHRGANAAIAVLVVVVVGGLAYLGLHHGQATSASRTATTADHGSSHGASATAAGTHHPSSSTTKAKKTTTTTSRPTQLLATTSTSAAATYSVPSSRYTVAVASSQRCWVQATAQPGGTVLWEGIVAPGGTQSVPASGRTTVELGAAGASITVNRTPVVLPTGAVTPFVVTFVPSAG